MLIQFFKEQQMRENGRVKTMPVTILAFDNSHIQIANSIFQLELMNASWKIKIPFS